jgi:hypothetical protein
MTTAEMLACLLYQRECTIAALQDTIHEQAIAIRHLKALLHEADHEVARAQQLASDSMVERWIGE